MFDGHAERARPGKAFGVAVIRDRRRRSGKTQYDPRASEGAFARTDLTCTIARMTTSPSVFHLSLPVRDLAAQRDFYVRVLGCKLCRVGQGFEDFEFLGHQLTFHEKPLGLDLTYAVMHFGAVVAEEEFHRLRVALLAHGAKFLVDAHEQATGTPDARWKMVFADASDYAIELKCYADPRRALAAAAAYPGA